MAIKKTGVEVCNVRNEDGDCLVPDCMFELQLQLVVVFTFKTYGQQAWEFLSPYLFGLLGRVWELRKLQKLLQLLAEDEPPPAGADDDDQPDGDDHPDRRLSRRTPVPGAGGGTQLPGAAGVEEHQECDTPRAKIKLSSLERESKLPAYGGTRLECATLPSTAFHRLSPPFIVVLLLPSQVREACRPVRIRANALPPPPPPALNTPLALLLRPLCDDGRHSLPLPVFVLTRLPSYCCSCSCSSCSSCSSSSPSSSSR